MTNRAIGLVLATLAIMLVVKRLVNAHAAIVTMLKVFGSSHTAETAFRTVVGLIFVRHPEITNGTMILSKLDVAFYASVAV